jgi:hypothetical protein
MKTRKLWAVGALLLSACASDGGMHEGMVQRDGSWYSPAAEGRGDYYTATERAPAAWDPAWGVGFGVVPFGGYCPVRYRYCGSPWWGYDPFYNPYWYQPWIYQRPPPRHRPEHRSYADVVGQAQEPVARPPARERAEPPRPHSWEERPQSAPARRSESAGARRRDRLSGDGSR